jgi:hypothetical protein
MRASPFPLGFVGAVCILAPGLSLGQTRSDPRSEMDGFAAALDAAVRRVSRSSPALLAGREGARGYRVPGFGALFVLPPRALPSASPRSLAEREAARSLDDAIHHLEQGLRTASSAELRAQMEKNLRALRQTRAELRGTARDRSAGAVVLSPPTVSAVMAGEDAEPAQPRLEDLQRALEAQMAAQMRALQEAERSHGDQEQEMARRMDAQFRELQARMEAMRREAERARVEAEREVEMRLGAPPAAPAPPDAPAVAEAPAAPVAPEPPNPDVFNPPILGPAPWQLWFSIEEPADGRTGETVVREVRAAVTALLEKQGPSLHQLKADEYVTVAVDFVPRVTVAGRRAQKTMVIKARKRDLDDHRAGRLGTAELHQRIEYSEY